MTECKASAITFIETGKRPVAASVEDGTSDKAATPDEEVRSSSDASGTEDEDETVGKSASDDRILSDDDGRSDPEPSEAADEDEAATTGHDDWATA